MFIEPITAKIWCRMFPPVVPQCILFVARKCLLYQSQSQDHRDLRGTAQNLNKLSTTGGAGGIIDLFYEKWRLDLATNPKIFRIVSTLWANTWGSEFHDLHQDDNNAVDSSVISQIDGLIQCVDSYLMNSLDRSANTTNDVDLIRSLYSHPFGSLDRLHDGLPSGFVYMNRVCYRVSDQISDLHSRGKKKRRKLQRCLAPHLGILRECFFFHFEYLNGF